MITSTESSEQKHTQSFIDKQNALIHQAWSQYNKLWFRLQIRTGFCWVL